MGIIQQTKATRLLLVQFFHPGKACPVKMPPGKSSVEVPWVEKNDNHGCGKRCRSLHTRRLISQWGTYMDPTGSPQRCQLAFWGEWEAETVAKKMPYPLGDKRYAHWVHEVKSPLRAKRVGTLDTDPCVFGRTFKYCYCQQRKDNSLHHLAPGSLVLFGSTIGGLFYLDTVFVVAGEGVPYTAPAARELSVSMEYRQLALSKVCSGKFTFYRGKTFQSGEPYSFVPARPFKKDDPECGRRFVLDVGKVNGILPFGDGLQPDQGRFHKDIPVDHETLESVWKEILRQVRDTGFLPAVRFNWPK